MKRILSAVLSLVVCVTGIGIAGFKSTSVVHAATEEDNREIYYHLDVGVWPMPYDGKSWTFGYGYGDTTGKPFTITFGRDIEVIGAHAYDPYSYDEPFDFDSPYCSSNVPVYADEACTTLLNTRPTRDDFIARYDLARAFTSNITNITAVNATARNVAMSYSVKLESMEETDAAKIAREHIENIEVIEETIDEITVKKYVLTGSDRAAKEKLLKEYKEERDRIRSTWASASKTPERLLVLENLILAVEKELSATKTVTQTITELQFDEDSYIQEFENYKNRVYSYWGGKTSLESYDPKLAAALSNVWENAGTEDKLKFDLVFVPIVIEYKLLNKVCEKCGECNLDMTVSDKVCTAKSCKDFGTTSCGCFEPPAASSSCSDKITFMESKSHTYYCGGCRTDEDGNTYCPGHSCTHWYTYEATLSTTGVLTAAKPNGNSTTFKSGYGFSVDLQNSITTRQIGNSGKCGRSLSKVNSEKPSYPESAEVRTNWTVSYYDVKAVQGRIIALENAGGGKFITAKNPVSHYENRLIYTDVALEGTRVKPKVHTITVYTIGGGVSGTKFCKEIRLSFTINGDFYEDDSTQNNRY